MSLSMCGLPACQSGKSTVNADYGPQFLMTLLLNESFQVCFFVNQFSSLWLCGCVLVIPSCPFLAISFKLDFKAKLYDLVDKDMTHSWAPAYLLRQASL